jgi:hypothetical protein
MTQALRIEDFNFMQLSNEESLVINGGLTIGGVAASVGGCFSAVVTVGQVGWLGATAVAICSTPAVAAASAVVGVVLAVYGVYALFS